ncbi:MAG: methionyl-tRNA formyltransferase [Bacteroidales bacterium]
MRIIYLGTPEFAVAPLDHLVNNGYQVVAVVTAPDKPAGRGKKLTPPPVKVYAESRKIPVLQPPKLKDEEFLDAIHSLKPDIQVVVAFRMMPKELWSIPEKGTFNLHASLLPQYRGAAPINWVLINGEAETGLTTFFIDEKIDTGEIIFREKVQIGENETAGDLHDRMMVKGSELVLKTVQAIEEGTVTTQPQPELEKGQKELKAAPKIYKDDRKIDWTKPAKNIHDLIRGLSPYPAAFSFLKKEGEDKIQVKIFKTEYEISSQLLKPGNISTDGKNYLKIA